MTGGSTQNKGVIPDIDLVSLYDSDLGERSAKNALKWDTIKTAPYVRVRDYSVALPSLQQASLARQVNDPQFVFLNEVRNIGLMNKDRKSMSLNIDQRRAEVKQIEKMTLDAENKRRIATGLTPYSNWESYQASIDAQSELRAKMKLAQRPPLPEEEAYVHEAAEVLLDIEHLKPNGEMAASSVVAEPVEHKPAS